MVALVETGQLCLLQLLLGAHSSILTGCCGCLLPLQKHPQLRTVVLKTGIGSKWRELQFELIAGEAAYVAKVVSTTPQEREQQQHHHHHTGQQPLSPAQHGLQITLLSGPLIGVSQIWISSVSRRLHLLARLFFCAAVAGRLDAEGS